MRCNIELKSGGQRVEIRTARSVQEVEFLREAWVAWGGHRDSDIDFVLMIIASYPEALRPHVIGLYRDGKPDAILIGRLEQKPLAFRVGYLNFFRKRVRCLTFVYGALRGNASPENAKLFVSEIMNSLKHREADVALLEFVPIESPLYHSALTAPGFFSRDTSPLLQAHDVMLVPNSIEEVYRRMSSDRRIELRRRIRKLESHAAGKQRIVCYRFAREMDDLFRDIEHIAKKTYQRGLGAGFSDTDVVRQRLGLAARLGWLRANVLYLGDRPIAFWVGMLYGQTFVSEYMGYDPEFRRLSPGMVLIMRVIEGFCARANGDNVRELDFGLGHAEYKAALCSKNWREGSVFIFSPSVTGVLLKVLRTVAQQVDRSARAVLARTAFSPRLKRLWRDGLSKHARIASPGDSEPGSTVTAVSNQRAAEVLRQAPQAEISAEPVVRR